MLKVFWATAKFLSCLYGSELFCWTHAVTKAFLSCLYGSEQSIQLLKLGQLFLSCLYGSERILHEAYTFWTGKDSKRKLPIEIDVSKAALKAPVKCADRKTRQIVTLTDAEEKGCDLFDREDLLAEYGDEEFANLFDCEFIDDSGS